MKCKVKSCYSCQLLYMYSKYTCIVYIHMKYKNKHCKNTNVHRIFFTIDFSQQMRFVYSKPLIFMVENTTKHFDQCGSHNDKNTLDFGGLGQIIDKITRF